MKKVLFLTTRTIYPVNDGRKVVLYNYCRGLAEKHKCEVKLFSILDEKIVNDFKNKPDFVSEIYCVNSPNKIEKIKNLFFQTLLFNKWPMQVSLYYSKNIQKKLDFIIKSYNPDIIICDMVRTSEYIKYLNDEVFNKLLDMDDILSNRYKLQLKKSELSVEDIGAYSKHIPKIIKKFIDNKVFIRFILSKEAKLLEKYEKSIADNFKKIIFVSPKEVEQFNLLIKEKKAIDITIGVDYEYLSKKTILKKEENTICFLGNMNVAHNKDAIKKFLNDIFPKVLKENPNTKLKIIGKCSEEYKNKFKHYKNIIVTGEVDDIRPYVQSSMIAIAPLTYGSGIKTKILETMAMGTPVITNNIGVEGIKVNNNIDIIICNDDESFSESIIELLRNKEKREEISKQAKETIKKFYQWDNILIKFNEII